MFCYNLYVKTWFLIGKKGSDIEKIKNKLSADTNEVNLNIKEVKKPETNSYLVAENIAQQLVKGCHIEEQ